VGSGIHETIASPQVFFGDISVVFGMGGSYATDSKEEEEEEKEW